MYGLLLFVIWPSAETRPVELRWNAEYFVAAVSMFVGLGLAVLHVDPPLGVTIILFAVAMLVVSTAQYMRMFAAQPTQTNAQTVAQ